MRPLYEIDNIKFGYGDKTVLDIERLEIGSGKVTALLGQNGAGKSTLLSLLAFLDLSQQGQLFFRGEKVEASRQVALRRSVGMVAQKPYLLRGSIFDNVALGLKFRGVASGLISDRVFRALERVGLADFASRGAAELSGGEAQKVALARALVTDPVVLLLDEPFSHLDQQSSEKLSDLLGEFASNQSRAVVFSAHDRLQATAMADEVLGIAAGNVIDTPFLNLYRGEIKESVFDTGIIAIELPHDITTGSHAVIDPDEIVLSRQPLESSMRNRFQGRIVSIADENGRVRLVVDAGERFYTQITFESLKALELRLGEDVWINFKSTSVQVF